MKQQSKFSTGQEHLAQQQSQSQGEQEKEFANADELLRFDAAHTLLPPEVAQRLARSAAEIPAPARRPWWKAWLGR